jgi:hypothetical protein
MTFGLMIENAECGLRGQMGGERVAGAPLLFRPSASVYSAPMMKSRTILDLAAVAGLASGPHD